MADPAVTLESTIETLKSLSIAAENVVQHVKATSPDSWKEALSSALTQATGSFQYTKTLLFKPKTSKTAKPYPVLLIARNDTETNTSALGKVLNLKDLRLAAPELIHDFLGATKDDGKSSDEIS